MTDLATNPQGGEAVADDQVSLDQAAEGVDTDALDTSLDQGAEAELDDQQPAEDDTEEVDYEGAKYKVPKPLKDAILRQADYTRKTQEVAATRQDLEQRQQAFAQQVQTHQAVTLEIGQYQALTAQIAQYDPTAIANLAAEDPGAALQYSMQRQALVEQQAALGRNITQKQQQALEQQRNATARQQQETFAQLQRDIPGFTSETVSQIEKFGAETYGYSQADFEQVADARHVKVLHDAMKWRAHEQQQRKTAKVVQAQKTAPVQTVRGQGGRFTAPADTSDFAAFERDADLRMAKR